jgi:AcrR family transcriptional regulator
VPVPQSRTQRSKDPRERLVREATEILARDGYSALTVRRVAEAAGYSTIAIYTHFGDKRKLIEAVLLEAHAAFEVAIAADEIPPGRAQLTASAQGYRNWALTNRSSYIVMFGSLSGDFIASPEAAEQMFQSFAAHTTRVAEAMRVGEITRAEPNEIAHHLWATVHGHVMLDLLMRRDINDETARRAFDTAIELMFDGVTQRPSTPRPTRRR